MSCALVRDLIRFDRISPARVGEQLRRLLVDGSTPHSSVPAMARQLILRLPTSLEVAVADCVLARPKVSPRRDGEGQTMLALGIILQPRFEWLDGDGRCCVDHVVTTRVELEARHCDVVWDPGARRMQFDESVQWTTAVRLELHSAEVGDAGVSKPLIGDTGDRDVMAVDESLFYSEWSVRNLRPWAR